MTISTTKQATQARVLVGLQRRVAAGTGGPATSEYLASVLRSPERPLYAPQVAAALALLEEKGLVERVSTGFGYGKTRWYITQAGLDAEVK